MAYSCRSNRSESLVGQCEFSLAVSLQTEKWSNEKTWVWHGVVLRTLFEAVVLQEIPFWRASTSR